MRHKLSQPDIPYEDIDGGSSFIEADYGFLDGGSSFIERDYIDA